MKKHILGVCSIIILLTSCATTENDDHLHNNPLTTVSIPTTEKDSHSIETRQSERTTSVTQSEYQEENPVDIIENEETISPDPEEYKPKSELVPDPNAYDLPPAVVECSQDNPGWSIWSNGTESYTEYCDLIIEEENRRKKQQDQLWGGYFEGSQDIYLEQPYKSSGGAQTHHGCLEGWIDNPEMCNKAYEEYGYPEKVIQ